ncbi:MAG: FtsW/RodA/SpoVE family cell cycle protein [Alistipes sp.]|jgi:cell division protein FtsW|nr:FtsW/RodA/SpoVE family cell cycle protein [Alistipes sp.]
MKQRERKINKTERTEQEIPSILSKVRLLHGDRVLWVIIPILMVISILVVYSSGVKYDTPTGNSTSANLWKHTIVIIIALVCLLIAYRFNAKTYRRLAPIAYLASLVLTVAVYFIGDSTNGAARWIDFGFFMLQPSELLKLATVIFMARQLAMKQKNITSQRLVPSFNPMKWREPAQKRIWMEGTLPVLLPVALSCIIILPAHTSSALLVFIISFMMMFIARVRWQDLLKILAVVAAAATLFVAVGAGRSTTIRNRIGTFFTDNSMPLGEKPLNQLTDPEHAIIAIHDGGIIGVGAGQSVMRAKITHPESDYMFAFFVEEYGIVMALFLLAIYAWIFVRAINIFKRSEWIFAGLLAVGLASLVTVQALLHILVSVDSFPETGQNLPLVSHGGTSMLCTAVALGIILAISRQIEEGSLIPTDRGEKFDTPTPENL